MRTLLTASVVCVALLGGWLGWQSWRAWRATGGAGPSPPQSAAEPSWARSATSQPPPAAPAASQDAPDATAVRAAVLWTRSTELAEGQREDEIASVLERDPYNEAALREGLALAQREQRWGDAFEAARRLAVLSPDEWSVVLIQSEALRGLSRPVHAADVLAAWLRRKPTDVTAWRELALAQQAARRWLEAEQAWSHMIDLAPDDPESHLGRGRMHEQMRAWMAASVDFGNALRLRPDSVVALQGLATAAIGLQRWDQARNCFDQAARLEPQNVVILNALAELEWRSFLRSGALDSLEAARRAWQRSLGLAPGQADIRDQLLKVQAALAHAANR